MFYRFTGALLMSLLMVFAAQAQETYQPVDQNHQQQGVVVEDEQQGDDDDKYANGFNFSSSSIGADDDVPKIEDEFLIPQISLFPNPSHSDVTIHNPHAAGGAVTYKYVLRDMNGDVVWMELSTAETVVIPRSSINKAGIYVLRTSGSGEVYFHRVIFL